MSVTTRFRERPHLLQIVYVVLGAYSLFALLYRLPVLPSFFTDEGLFLSTADTLVDEGVYATKSLYTYYSANMSVGAPVIVPMALVMRLFGSGLLQGRLVIIVFSMLALILAARLATALFGRWAGPLAWWTI